jgi:hypothetical protein
VDDVLQYEPTQSRVGIAGDQTSDGSNTMKKLILASAMLVGLPALASPPVEVWFETSGEFDANLILSGSFVSAGAFDEQGSLVDSPIFNGVSIHVTRTMTTSGGDIIVMEINGNHVTGSQVIPTWCAPPTSLPPGTFLFPESGNWRVLYGTGSHASLKGNGSWATWVAVDQATGSPRTANECMSGTVHVD